ncbi:hypothetical protein J3R30DRAFT_3702008 [Lentinula aciculospora]|uniref:Uncharacterized protein n=1 Tax=Lentinula aciculospora TaxID=153920 RepID=A0A9W9DPP3_9AGAR|nr:hypothetical protein J3R30DRAFT_3702008 [Lentinula aciculospora]
MLGHQQLPSLSPNPPHLGLGLNSGYNSNSNDFPTSSNSPSPPLSSAGIRLPNAPLTDIAEYRSHSVNSNGDYTEYTEYDHHSNDTLNTKLGYSEPYNDSYSNSPYLNNHVHLSSSSSPSPLPRTPHSLPLPLSSTNSPYLVSSHLASPHLGSPGNMIPSPLAEAQQIQSQISAGSSSNGSTSTLMGISSDTSDSANGKGSPMMMPPSLTRDLLVPVGSGSSGQRNKSHTISTGSPYEAYLNASREVRGQEQRNPRMLYGAHRERSGSVSSAYSTNSAGSTQSSRSPSILHSARSVHASLPEDAGEGDLVVHVNGSMGKMHMGLGSSYELHEVARLSPCSNPMETLDPSVLDGERV